LPVNFGVECSDQYDSLIVEYYCGKLPIQLSDRGAEDPIRLGTEHDFIHRSSSAEVWFSAASN